MTLAAWKRSLKPGQRWHCTNHFIAQEWTREVKRVQSNGVVFQGPTCETWLPFPKAKDFRASSDGKIHIFVNGQLALTYTLVEAGA